MPLFKLKKTVMLSSAISAAMALTACGGGGGGAGEASKPCDSTFSGESVVVIDDYSVAGGVGTLKGHVADASTLASVTLNVRGQSTLEATIDTDGTCQTFTVGNIPLAETVAAHRFANKNDAEADYTLTVVNNDNKSTVKTFLAAGSELETATAMQLNDSAFQGTNGVVSWLEGVLSAYDIQDELAKTLTSDEVPVAKRPFVYAAAADFLVPSHISDTEIDYSLLRGSAETNTQIKALIQPILDTVGRGGDDFYIYVTNVRFGGEELDSLLPIDNGARITMGVNGPENAGDTGFDIDTSVVFNGGLDYAETIISARIVSVGSPNTISGTVDIDFVIPDLTMKAVFNTSDKDAVKDATSLLSFLANQTEVTGKGLFQLIGTGEIADIFSAVNVTACNSLCASSVPADWVNELDINISTFVNVQKEFRDALDPIDDPDTPEVDESVDSIANKLRDALASVNEKLVTAIKNVELSKSGTKAMTVTSAKGDVKSVLGASTVTGGFISAGGSALYDVSTGAIVNHAIGSIYEAGVSSVITNGDLAGTGGVVIAVSEASINQMLLASFESDLLLPKEFQFKAKELITIAGINPEDDIFVTTQLGAAPYVDVGSNTNKVKAVMEGLSLNIYLKPIDPAGSLVRADDGDDKDSGKILILTVELSPVGEMEYEVKDGLPNVITPVATDLHIHTLTTENSAVDNALTLAQKDKAWLQDQISGSVLNIIQEEVAKLGNAIANANKHSTVDLKPSTGELPSMLASALPSTLNVVLRTIDGISSDVDGKMLLLNGDLQVVDGAENTTGALYSFTLCDSSKANCVK
ncbi:MAG: hypothetical protein HRU20_26110 [Pseudomonadales bacterium]|nr:hypothetical protein [Pseudomonadales bacterium]